MAEARTVQALGAARPDVVAGYADLGDHLVVYVARSAAPRQRLTVTRQLRKAPLVEGAARRPVTVVLVPRSAVQLRAVMDRVGGDRAWNRRHGAAMTTWYPDPSTGRVVVETTEPSPATVTAARRAFGPAVQVRRGQPIVSAVKRSRVPPGSVRMVFSPPARRAAAPGAVPGAAHRLAAATTAGTRLLDARPYYGGDRIVRVAGSFVFQCTTAFQVMFAKVQETSSAGHCSPGGTAWYQGYFDAKANVVRHTGRMGTVVSSSFENRQVDGLVMNGGSWLPYVWTAGTGGDGIAHVVAARTPVLRDAVCSNGSFTGQNCAGKVRTVNSCVQVREDEDTVVRACGMASAASTNGTWMVQAGDSGGPVYRRVTGGVQAEGVISAMSDDHKTVFFAEINDFTKKFSVTVAR